MSRSPRRIALVYDGELAFSRKVMSGVAAYLQEAPVHSVYISENAFADRRIADLRAWGGDGIIADFNTQVVADAVVNSGIPAVAFGCGEGWYVPEAKIPSFFSNNAAIASLTIDHLIDRGIRRFAYCGYSQRLSHRWSKERQDAFTKLAEQRGFTVSAYNSGSTGDRNWAAIERSLAAWLRTLPKPVGVLAANDHRARQVLEACRAAGIRVPQEIKVIGVDNDELVCQLSSPLLTSIEQGTRRIGYEAASLLDKIMEGKSVRRLRYVVNPVGIVTRQSTDLRAIDDPLVAKAMAIVQKGAVGGIRVADIASQLAVSRSGLESHFRAAMGCSVRGAVRQVQLDEVKRLITDTSMALKEIAAATGFRSVQHMTTLFRRAFGNPPAKHRIAIGS